MRFTNSPVAKLFAVLAVLALAGLAIGAVAATDHVDTLTGDDTDVIQDFNASDEQFIEYDLEATGADFDEDGTEDVAINVSFEDIDHYENTSIEVDGADSAHTFNLSHADLETVPGDALDTTTVNVTAWGEDADGEITTGADEFEIDLEFAEERSTVYLAEDTTTFDDDLDVEEPDDPGILQRAMFWSDADDVDTYALDTEVGVANGTEVHVFTEDADDGFDAAAEAYDTSETPVLGQTLVLDAELVPVYYGDAADWQDTDEAYGVYENGELVVHNADEIADPDDDEAEDVDMEYASANALDDVVDHDLSVDDVRTAFDEDELTVGDLREEFSITEIGILEWATSFAWVPFAMIGLAVPVALRRRTEA